ncbi:phosphotransferase [Pseudonocardia nigra]|uniref:phosphotransferase n=1 Tax=Pseudonocardia nigra TaxID=1921578 RepID=UPI001C5DB6CB|nr:phosphotransferase [Pseudonocardia nigra]
MTDAAERLGLEHTGARMISSSSRMIWHLPRSGSALTLTRPGAKTSAAVASEAAAIHAAVAAGVRTPRLIAGPITLHEHRHAMACEWVTGRRPARKDWPAIVAETARLATASTERVLELRWPPDVPDARSLAVLGERLAANFVSRCRAASDALGSLVRPGGVVLSHGDLQPGNVLIDPDDQAWLIDLEYACSAPREWDPAKLLILSRRFADPPDVDQLLTAWGDLDAVRLEQCVAAQEVLLVGWLARMAVEGTAGAGAEARRRAASLTERRAAWRHLG